MTHSFNVKRAIDRFQKERLDFRLVPIEAKPSLPVPVLHKGNIFLSLLYFTAQKVKPKEKIKIFRPSINITIDASTAKIALYRNYLFLDRFENSNWNNPIGEFPHAEIESLTLAEYYKHKNRLIEKYDKAISLLYFGEKDELFRIEFRNSFFKLCEPCLLEYMEKNGIVFFSWLEDD